MSEALEKLTIKGFKSIRELENFELKKLNILIGANGAGKSNFIDVFRLLNSMMSENLSLFIKNGGGISDFLHKGRKITGKMEFELQFGVRGYRFTIVPAHDESFSITKEARYYKHGVHEWWELGDADNGIPLLVKEVLKGSSDSKYSELVYRTIMSWMIYHFHDTSSTASMRHYEIIQDNEKLKNDAANIAPFLYRLKAEESDTYNEIVETIRMVTPFFKDFLLKPEKFGEKEKICLQWYQKNSDYPMQPYHLSDGTLRFICLATALLQPEPPSSIIIDEPELGLHPQAVNILSELIQSASQRTQMIVSTQSPSLIDNFGIEDIIVVNRKDGASTFERLDEKDFNAWLEDYSIGELWEKNVITGGTVCE